MQKKERSLSAIVFVIVLFDSSGRENTLERRGEG